MIKLYCTFDNVSEEFSVPWTAKNDNVARRNLLIAAKRQNLPLNDIKLYCIGSYSIDNGKLFDTDNPEKVLSQVELVLPTDVSEEKND